MTKPVVVEISNEPLIPGRSGVTARTGQPYNVPAKQKAYFHNVAKYPVAGEVSVVDTVSPYRPGLYLIAGSCFVAGQYGVSFDDRALELIPLAEGIKALEALKAPA